MNRIYQDTINKLQDISTLDNSVLVSYSGGKDSLVVMDLCCRYFKTVKAFFMYFVEGLECCERQLDFARKKWGVDIIQYPHWNYIRCLRDGIYCFNSTAHDKLPDWKLKNVYEAARFDSGINLIATGAKASDSQWRRRNLVHGVNEGVFCPLKEWNKFDVLAYLKINNIPEPNSSNRQATGVDLSTPSILWLYDNYPDDFKTLLKEFPLARAAVTRRDKYGIK